MKHQSGSASIELVAVAPIAALFILVAAQLGITFSRAVRDAADAGAYAARAVREWDNANKGHGLRRPCIEDIKEVNLAAEQICVP